jgi:predicted amidohydrolase YtcJ
VILENGLIRTLDPQVPTLRALAIAGEWVAGGGGVHETALASPEVVDLGGRVVLPGFTDSHVHFPTWALAQTEVGLDGCETLAEALDRVSGAQVRDGRWLRGYGWRSGDWTDGREPTKEDLDAVTGERPAALIAKDYHSLWLNSAALAFAGGDLEVDGGVVERDANGEPTGVLREEACWRFKERYMVVADDEYLDAMRTGVALANARGVTAVHDKDGWLGAVRLWQQLEERGSLSLRVWQSIPAD